ATPCRRLAKGRCVCRKLSPKPAIQLCIVPPELLSAPSELFQEERDARPKTLIAYAASPRKIHLPCAWSRLSPHDDPVNHLQWQSRDWSEQGLYAQKSDRSRHESQIVCTMAVLA